MLWLYIFFSKDYDTGNIYKPREEYLDTPDDLPFPVMDVNESEMSILVTIIQTGRESLKEYWTMTH